MSLLPGARLGTYEIVAAIGEGGMGVVYRARDTRLDRLVAVKVLPRDVSDDPERRERFEREAKAVAALNHPGIVTIHSVENVDGVSFMTMELVEGETLTNAITSSGMPLSKLLAIAIPIVDAMAAAHDKGITHRDLKPANVMVAANGRVKVLDFGLAKVGGGALAGDGVTGLPTAIATGEGRILGTVAYMSPEQAEGKAIDARSDLFSLGVLLYEMATGRRPFTGDTSISIISSIVKDTPKPVTEINPGLPRDLGRIVKRALAKDPERRYQTAKDLRNDLEELKASLDSGELAAAPTVAPAAHDRRLRATSWIALGAGAIAIAAIAIAVSLWNRTPPPATPAGNVVLRPLTTSGNVAAAAISPDGRYVAYVQLGPDGSSLWVHQVASGSTVQIVPPMAANFPALTVTPDGSFVDFIKLQAPQWEMWRVPLLGGAPRRIVERAMSAPGWSPDGTRMAYMVNVGPNSAERQLVVAAGDGSNPRVVASRRLPKRYYTLTLLSRPDVRPIWIEDGKTIAVLATDEAELPGVQALGVDVETGAEKLLYQFPPGTGGPNSRMGFVVTPDGRSTFATLSAEVGTPSQAVRIDFADGRQVKLTNDLASYGGASLGGDALVTTRSEARTSLWIADATGRGERRIGGDLPSVVNGMTWSGPSRVLYGAALVGGFGLWSADVETGATQMIIPGGVLPSATLDGTTIAFLKIGNELWRANADGSRASRLAADFSGSYSQITPDGSRLFYRSSQSGTQATWVLDLATGATRQFAQVLDNGAAISRDGRRVAVRSNLAERVYIFAAEGGDPIQELPVTATHGDYAWTPDGRGLAFIDPSRANIWVLPIDGSAPRQLTSFAQGNLSRFAWSPDGKQLLVARETITSNLVLLTGVR
ncbi:MAG TPA: protein kinase [Vicinamibacterales bacterium]|nr:protein kinase [Vicinamibacterales bacterium]